jgi:hypothetical protein
MSARLIWWLDLIGALMLPSIVVYIIAIALGYIHP